MSVAGMLKRTTIENGDGPRFERVSRDISPLLYAHVDLGSSIVQAEAPVNIGWHALAPALVFTVLATVAVVLRWYARARLTRTIAKEDWLLLFALILSIAMTGVVGGEVYVASKMVGHRWNEEANDVSIIAKLVLCSNLLYQVLTNATKSSFLLQYLRLFQQRWIQWACKASLAVVFGAALYGFFGGIFMCNPATKYWNPSVPGHCSDAQRYWFASALLGILMDFVVWLLPMPLIKGLRLPLRQKLSLTAVFALGGFVCVVSILRILLVHMYAANDNMEGAGIAAITWSTVEANVGIICASLMVMKPLVAKVFPRLLDSTGPSRRNLRLPTITEDTMGPICWNRNWEWGSTNGAMCSASRPSSWMHAPQDSHAILVTKKSVVEANWTGRDSISGNTLRKPSRAYGRDSVV